jgi:small subunit ribosomal protein S20
MPNIKSSAKRDQIAKTRNVRNKARRTALKTTLKKFEAAVIEGNRENAMAAHKLAVKTVDRAVTKGILHKNNAAHKKSRMARMINQISQ